MGGPAAEAFKRCGSAFRAEGWKVLEELGIEGDGELAKLAGWARQCLHLDDERLGTLPLSARRPEARRRYSQLAKAAAERVLDVAERIPYDLYAPIDGLQFNRRRIILGLANKTKR